MPVGVHIKLYINIFVFVELLANHRRKHGILCIIQGLLFVYLFVNSS